MLTHVSSSSHPHYAVTAAAAAAACVTAVQDPLAAGLAACSVSRHPMTGKEARMTEAEAEAERQSETKEK